MGSRHLTPPTRHVIALIRPRLSACKTGTKITCQPDTNGADVEHVVCPYGCSMEVLLLTAFSCALRATMRVRWDLVFLVLTQNEQWIC